MKRQDGFLLSLVLTIAVLAVIFCFSAQPAGQSDGISISLARRLAALMPWLLKKVTVRRLNRILRKMAHFVLYFLLGCGLTGVFRIQNKIPAALSAVAAGALCAALDEWHQWFVPGRGPGMGDVLLDVCGVAAAAVFAALLDALRRRRKEK